VHAGLWLIVTGAILYSFGWVQLVRCNWQLDAYFLADDLLILLPAILPLILSWAAFYEVDKALQSAEAAADARWRMSRKGYLGFQVRFHLALLLLPVLLLLAINDALELSAPSWLESEHSWLIFTPVLLALAVFLPVLLRYVWDTEPLEAGSLRDRLQALARRWKFRPNDILIWNTGRRVVNAAVAGYLPRMRFVMLSDTLLEHFSQDEIEAIFAHEVGHSHRRHLLLRMAALVAPLVWISALSDRPALPSSVDAAWLSVGVGNWQLSSVVPALAVVIYLGVVFGFYCRQLERDADLFACQAIGPEPTDSSSQLDPEAIRLYARTLAKIALVAGFRPKLTTWLHPSVASRIEFVQRMAANPLGARRFRIRVNLLSGLLIFAIAVGVVALLL